MTRRMRDLALGLILAGVTFLGVLWQVNESVAAGADEDSVPRLICPLH